MMSIEFLTVTDNSAESLRISYDGERYALVHTDKTKAVTKTIILNPQEALAIEYYIRNSGYKTQKPTC